MILQRILWWGFGRRVGGCWGSSGGVLGPRQPPPAPRPMLIFNGRLRGIGNILRLFFGGRNYLHTVSLPSTPFTWSRRRRRRRREREGLPTVSTCRHCSNFFRKGEIKDDEVRQGMERGRSDGEFFDSKYHHHHNIQHSDIGVKVNVGEPVMSTLHHLYHIPRETALAMVRSDSFLMVSDTAIVKTLYFMKDHQITREQLLRVPWVLLHSFDTLQAKFSVLQQPHLFDSIPNGLGFCWFSLKQIRSHQHSFEREAANFPHHPNRLYYLAERLEVPVAVLTEKVVKPKQVLRMDIKRLDYIIEILKGYNVHMDDVVSDLWVFRHNVKMTENRLRQATEAGCTHPKPWICHSTSHAFERYLERYSTKRQVLGEGGSMEAYLSARLQCPICEVRLAFQRNSGLKSMHASKVKRMVDLLLAEGFTQQDIRYSLRVLQHSERRTKRRIQEMKSLGHFPFPISLLYKRSQTYFNYVQRIKRELKEVVEEEDKCLKKRWEYEEEKEGEER